MTDDAAARPDDPTPPHGDVAQLAAWRQAGAHRLDPVRFTFLEALARRAAGLQGPARRLLDVKLSNGLAAYAEKVAAQAATPAAAPARRDVPAGSAPAVEPAPASTDRPRSGAAPAGPAPRPQTPRLPGAQTRGPLADIVDLLGRADVSSTAPPDASDAATSRVAAPSLLSTAPPDLKTLSYFRSTWTRLSADQRLSHALEQVPENAGPLNSQHLVHRALATMRDTSPAYLQRFVAYVDALLWMDQVHSQAFVLPARDDKPEPVKKGTRRRSA